jgi:hypothetical protein
MPPPDLLSGTNLAEGDDDKLWINLKHLVRASDTAPLFFYRASQNKYGNMFSLLIKFIAAGRGSRKKNEKAAHKKRPDMHHVVKTEYINYF